MEGYRPATYGDGFADVYDDWYADVSPPQATASFVAERTRGPVLELGSGTGRLAGPLATRGVPVIGLDASVAMLRRSRSSQPAVPVVAADMAEPPVRDRAFGAVLVAFNTLFNLPSGALQRRALAHAARAVRPDGIVVVEAFVPGDAADEAGDRVDVVRLEADLVVLRISRTASRGPDDGLETGPERVTVSGHHVELRDGAPVRLRPWQVCFCAPAELDRSAGAAGLELVERYADWESTPFDDESAAHVSVYRLADRPRIVSPQ